MDPSNPTRPRAERHPPSSERPAEPAREVADVSLSAVPKPRAVEPTQPERAIELEARDLSVYYGETKAIKNVSITIPERRVVAFIGPSGCGKSTLLRCFNRMTDEVPDASMDGSVLFRGKDLLAPDVNAVKIRRQIGMVFQRPNPFPKSIYDNVAFGPRRHGITKGLDDLVEQSLKRAALWDEVKNRLRESAMGLSGGQQQRLCIARALAVSPDVLLMDEPCASLDPISTQKVEELIYELKRDYTVVLVTHNMQQAARVSDFTAFLYVGELVEYSTTSDLFTKPREKRTEDYITGRFG
jgi:phosphate transport system ATP-binding protein